MKLVKGHLRKYILFRIILLNLSTLKNRGPKIWFFGIVEAVARYIPGEIGNYLRYKSYTHLLKSLGKDVIFHDGVIIENPENVSIGSHCSLNHRTHIHGLGGVKIGNYVRIAPNVSVVSHNLRYWEKGRPMISHGYEPSEVVIEEDVWIGTGAIILAGVKVKSGSVIGAGAVVIKDVPPNSVVAGVPAKVIKTRPIGKEQISSSI